MLHSISAKDYMEANLVSLKPDMDILDAIHLFLQNDIAGAAIFLASAAADYITGAALPVDGGYSVA